MERITPYNKEDLESWEQQNEEAIQKIHDESLKAIINAVLNMHELEHTGAWRHSRRRLDYSKLSFEIYLHHHTTWSLSDFRLLEEAVFEHFDELKRNGLGNVLKSLSKWKRKR